MNLDPRSREDYNQRQVEAARRVLIDIGQVLAPYKDCMVLVGGWVPDLLLGDAEEPHIGSVDVDVALDAVKLNDGRYAEMLRLLLNTKRYSPGPKDFQLVATVDLKDGEKPVEVDLEFLAPKNVKLTKRRPKLIEGFRVLQADGCAAAFHNPQQIELSGRMMKGATNTIQLQVASLPDFLIMKAHAIGGRDKPKDVYDFCYCLEHYPGGIAELAEAWKARNSDNDVIKAIAILKEKFETVQSFGSLQLAEFHGDVDDELRSMQARQAFELVNEFLRGT